MFKIILALCCALAIQAQHHASHIPLAHVDQHHAYRVHDESPKPYEFAYDTELEGGHMGRKESGDSSGKVVGSYSLSENDGRSRVVEYVADANGFHANVKTNEPGTKSENPADVIFYSSAPEVTHVVRAPVHHHYAAHQAAPHPYYIRRAPYFY